MFTYTALCSFEDIFQLDNISLHMSDPNIFRNVFGNSKACSAIVNPLKYVIRAKQAMYVEHIVIITYIVI